MNRFHAFLAACALAFPAVARADDPDTSWQKVQEAFASAIETGHKSTVGLEVKADFRTPPPPMNLEPGAASDPNYTKRPSTPTSGVVIDKEGDILTSFFNVDGKVKKITVIFPDGKSVEGKLLGVDESKDLALIKVDPKAHDLSPIEWAEEQPAVGAFVMALGRSPEPTSGTATRGIVSAVDRVDQMYNSIWEQSIQFDAKTNYGNSGGPVIDLHGRLVGTVAHVRLQSPWGQNSGISFCTPGWKIKEVLADLKAGKRLGKPKLPFLGVGPKEGAGTVIIGSISPGTAAEKAGLLPGDLVLQIDEIKVKDWADFTNYIKKKKPGDTVTVKVTRGEETLDIQAVLGERPNN
ncbi:MAG: S1C family serine protease [Planctomycetes bacterium]|nr:S1C family serine protease [Planctomycetota bacterium]